MSIDIMSKSHKVTKINQAPDIQNRHRFLNMEKDFGMAGIYVAVVPRKNVFSK